MEIGQKVRIISNEGGTTHFAEIGDTGTIENTKELAGAIPIMIHASRPYVQWVDKCDFEIIEPMT